MGSSGHGEVKNGKLRRQKVLEHFANRPACLVGMEACGGAHHWARELMKLGHQVRLLAGKASDPAAPRHVGQLRLVDAGKGASLQYGADWLASGFPLSEDLVLVDIEQLPRWKGMAVGVVDDARPDRWGERVIQHLDKPARLSIMEYLFYAGDDRFGALGVSTSADAHLARTRIPLPRLAHAQQLSEIVHKVSAEDPVNDISARCWPPAEASAEQAQSTYRNHR